ncbi:MAG TPA: hypothetical protein VL749_06385 [Patescibacteria group bacterium]|nr:hypothetical protein [Patescibacteria group bacterium]
MTRDPHSAGYDDATIEQLVRDVAEEWTMPPVRLDAPGWRARVRSSRTRRLVAAEAWFGRLGQAATAAVALTVVGALVAVLITRPPEPGKTPEPSSGSGPSASPGARATSLPKLLVTGDEPDPAIVVMRSERGDFARVDLTTGSINGPLTGKSSASQLRVAADGSMVCLCVAESGNIGGQPTDVSVSLERYDARGKLAGSTPIEQFSGEPDPRDASIFVPERPAHVLTDVSFSDDGRYGFVGWSLRAHPVWHSGVVVVDLADGSIASRLDLPDATDGEGDTRRVIEAPRVAGMIHTGSVLIARGFYEWSPPASQEPTYTFENHVFTASLDAGQLADAKLVPTASDCGGSVVRAGPLPEGAFWVACTSGGAELTVIRRLGPDNSLLGDVRISGSTGIDTDPTAVSADGSKLYVWDPSSEVLTRVDLASGDKTSGKGIAAADAGPLAALGNWLAPAAAAKSWLRGALAVSPDGSRVYAIGIREGADERDVAGSTGVFVFDATTLEPATVWQPTADYVSIAVSADGKLVFAAGLPGVDAAGRNRIAQQASITVFDASDGSIRLIAGQLGGDALTFLSARLR